MSLEYFFDEHLAKHAPKLGISTISDLLFYLPKKYNDYSRIDTSFEDVAREGRPGLFRLRVKKVSIDTRKRPARAYGFLSNGREDIAMSCFGAIFSWKGVRAGDLIHVQGKIDTYNGNWQLQNAEVVPQFKVGKVFAEYKGVKGSLSHEHIAKCISQAVSENLDVGRAFIESYLKIPESDILLEALPEYRSINEFIREIHFPSSIEGAEQATRCAARLNAYAVMRTAAEVGKKSFDERSMVPVDYDKIRHLVGQLPFSLTQDQRRCVYDICEDIRSPYTMDRVISGDVGCGKTMAYGIPAAYASKIGKRVIVIVPNLMLAHQIHEELTTTFEGVQALLVVDGHDIKTLDNEMLVGTTAILNLLKRNPEYKADLVIVDEQQKFSQEQKLKLLHPHTNLVQASATPIPKTMGEIIFGNKAVSYIEETPVKKSIRSFVVTQEDKPRVMRKLLSIVKNKHQISVLYPLRSYNKRLFQVEISHEDKFNDIKKGIQKLKGKRVSKPQLLEDERLVTTFVVDADASENVVAAVRRLSNVLGLQELADPEAESSRQKTVEDSASAWERLMPGRVVSVHGGMDVEAKKKAVESAKRGDCDAIITSSVIEIGLTFPGLMGMLVVDADRYGASTLHQIRGRLARKGGQGFFFMLIDKPRADIPPETLERLNILVNATKGSEVAYGDMMQRGFGELASEEGLQSGHLHSIFPSIKIRPQDILALSKLKRGKSLEKSVV